MTPPLPSPSPGPSHPSDTSALIWLVARVTACVALAVAAAPGCMSVSPGKVIVSPNHAVLATPGTRVKVVELELCQRVILSFIERGEQRSWEQIFEELPASKPSRRLAFITTDRHTWAPLLVSGLYHRECMITRAHYVVPEEASATGDGTSAATSAPALDPAAGDRLVGKAVVLKLSSGEMVEGQLVRLDQASATLIGPEGNRVSVATADVARVLVEPVQGARDRPGRPKPTPPSSGDDAALETLSFDGREAIEDAKLVLEYEWMGRWVRFKMTDASDQPVIEGKLVDLFNVVAIVRTEDGKRVGVNLFEASIAISRTDGATLPDD